MDTIINKLAGKFVNQKKMLYSFHQYETLIQGTMLEGIVANDRAMIADAERFARDLVQSKLATRYDLTAPLRDLLLHDPNSVYAVGDLVTDGLGAAVYACLAPTPITTPLTDAAYWQPGIAGALPC